MSFEYGKIATGPGMLHRWFEPGQDIKDPDKFTSPREGMSSCLLLLNH